MPLRHTVIRLIQSTAVIAKLTLAMLALPLAQAAPNLDKSTADRAALAQLSGRYASSSAEDWGRGAFGTRDFSFEDGKWTLKFTLALDPQMNNKVFEFRTHGHYFIGATSKTVRGAFDALFTEDAKYVTLFASDPKLVSAFGLSGCGLTPNVEKDVSKDGCAAWKPVAVCNQDHDLLALDAAGGLRFGVRPQDNDMCSAERRPTALLPAVVKR